MSQDASDKNAPAAEPDEVEPPPDEEQAHSREGHEGLPFGDDPQAKQGDDPASGSS